MQRLTRLGSFLIVAVGFFAGCAIPAADSEGGGIGHLTQAVQGGQDAPGYAFAVGICLGDAPGNCRTVCTGALVGTNLVLTSRHCLDEAREEAIQCATDRFGPARALPTSMWITTASSVLQNSAGWHRGKRGFIGTN